MSTGFYNGPATLVLDGKGVAITARLRSGVQRGLVEWSGALASDDADWHAALMAGMVTLRLPNGQEGTALITRYDVPSTVVQVVGSGPPPF